MKPRVLVSIISVVSLVVVLAFIPASPFYRMIGITLIIALIADGVAQEKIQEQKTIILNLREEVKRLVRVKK